MERLEADPFRAAPLSTRVRLPSREGYPPRPQQRKQSDREVDHSGELHLAKECGGETRALCTPPAVLLPARSQRGRLRPCVMPLTV